MESRRISSFKPVAALFLLLLFVSPTPTFAFTEENSQSGVARAVFDGSTARVAAVREAGSLGAPAVGGLQDSFASPSASPTELDYDAARGGVWVAAQDGNIYLVEENAPHTVLSTINLVGVAISGDGDTNGVAVLENGNLLLSDLNGDLINIDDYLFEINPDTLTLINYWPVDGLWNTSTDGTSIDQIIGVEIGPNGHAYVTTWGGNSIYEIALAPGSPGTWGTVAVHTATTVTRVLDVDRIDCPDYQGWLVSDYNSTTVAFLDDTFATIDSFAAAHDSNTHNIGVTAIDTRNPMHVWATDTDTDTIGVFDSELFCDSTACGAFYENFDDGTADDWSDDGSGAWSVASGVYRMTDTGGSSVTRQTHYSGSASDFIYEARVRKTSGSSGASMGLLYRSDGDQTSNTYVFHINSSGSYYTYKYVNGVWTSLSGGWISHAAINQGLNVWNTLKVEARGNQFDLYSNGTLLTSFTDSSHTSGQPGLKAYESGSYADVVEFDDVRLSCDPPLGDELAVDFGTSGLWNYDGSTNWTKISNSNVQWLKTSDGKMAADFGASGLWENDHGIWQKISTGNADNSGNTMAVFRKGPVVDFGSSGLYFYNNVGWEKISNSNVQWVEAYHGKLAADFGGLGLWEYNGGAWVRITTTNPDNSGNTMVAYNSGLAVDFGASGLYFYNGGIWSRISPSNVQWLAAYDGKLAADFGAYGTYEYDGAAWTRITTGNPDNSGNTMVAYNDGLVVDFGASGLYFYNGSSWTRLSPSNVQWLTVYGDKLAADFGASGMYEYDGAGWAKLTTGNADNNGNTMTDW